MKSAAVILAAAAVASAQVTFNSTSNTWMCAIPGAVYCASDSLQSNIIIRCNATGFGQPGNCNDNLAGEPPLGVNYAPCWQSNATAGDAACSKNCVVYGGSGNFNGTFTLPASVCTPSYTASSSSSSGAPTSTSASSTGSSIPPVSTSGSSTTICTTSTTGIVPPPLSTGPSSSSGGNGTVITKTSTQTSGGPTPVGPTSTPSSVPTAGAVANAASGALAVVGIVVAAML